MIIPHIQQATESYLTVYKQPEIFRDEQLKIFWTADEIKVEKDVHDILTNFTPAETHGVFTTLKSFTHYEMFAGEDYWTGRFMKMFPRHEFTSMASVFGMFELAVHAPFYNKINVLLNAHDDGFYTDYISSPVLKSRMETIDNIINDEDDVVSLACFSLIEGVILYSSFAFLKHFQSLGKNKLLNVVRGINFSVRDENLHAQAGAWCFRELVKQMGGLKQRQRIEIVNVAIALAQQEYDIIDMIFEKGPIDGISKQEMKAFVIERTNACLENLGMSHVFDGTKNNISNWFYKGINNYQMNDFFSGQGREYSRNWDEKGFIWS